MFQPPLAPGAPGPDAGKAPPQAAAASTPTTSGGEKEKELQKRAAALAGKISATVTITTKTAQDNNKAAFLANAPATIAPVLPPVAVKPPAGAQQSSSTNNMATITPIYSTVTTAAGTNMHGLNEKSDLGRRFHRLHFPCPFR